MKKLLSLALAAALLLAFAACGSRPASINPALVLGEKYLFDMEYEQALLQFDQAITIEPRSTRAWLGKYAALEFTDSHEGAVQTLRGAQKKIDKADRETLAATLAAAEISAGDGLLAAAEAYKGFGFKEIALKLLELCVKAYQGAERFTAALSALTQEMGIESDPMADAFKDALVGMPTTAEATTTAEETSADAAQNQSAIELGDYIDLSKNDFTVSGTDLARILSCTSMPPPPNSYQSLCYTSPEGIEMNFPDPNLTDWSHTTVSWTTPTVSLWGLKVGDPAASVEPAINSHIPNITLLFHDKDNPMRPGREFYLSGGSLLVMVFVSEGKISEFQLTSNFSWD